ncbi:MAG TPA: P-loop NTPase fold protein, partial [Allosphingosinicella sp.]|nr:P-loop NTPase fold protein [Allosphingosinicella sp.]
MSEWRARLHRTPGSLAFFFFSGPVLMFGPQLSLALAGKDRPDLIDFDNLWYGMRSQTIGQQLLFVDGCRADWLRSPPPEPRLRVLTPQGLQVLDERRARYFGWIPAGEVKAEPGWSTPLTRSLLHVVEGAEGPIGTHDLSTRLNAHFLSLTAQAGIPNPRPIDASYGDFEFHHDDPEPEPTDRTEAAPNGEAPSATAEPLRLDLISRLTPRQRECLRLVSMGLSSTKIGPKLHVSPLTVDRHLHSAMRILKVDSRFAAAEIFAQYEKTRGRSPEATPSPEEVEPTAASEDIEEEGEQDAAEGPSSETDTHFVDDDPEAAGSEASREEAPDDESQTHFVDDDPEVERDALNRGPLAIALGRRLHRIWCRSNGIRVPGSDEASAGGEGRAAFVLHLDAPWGGGKTSFANFLARVLNPFPAGCAGPASFLAERGEGDVGAIFIDDPHAKGPGGKRAADWPKEARRPWVVVNFNAWQAEHCTPPWWVFYQAIRKGCFDSVRAEGDFAWTPAPPPEPAWRAGLVRGWRSARAWFRGKDRWAALVASEYGWRLFNPKILSLLLTAIISLGLLGLLIWSGGWGVREGGQGGPSTGFILTGGLGVILTGLTGITAIWGLGALFTESIVPGTSTFAERLSLGNGDPFARFRRHFARTMERVRRPVMVIVDDLDRCRPDFVVDLVRGIQTLLRSPRVVFVILGDRAWIERAFESHHQAMSTINVGSRQSFGARFVQKAIQMSFILPEIPDELQHAYVRRVLLGSEASAAADAPPPASVEASRDLKRDYRREVATADTPEARARAEIALHAKTVERLVDEAAAAAAA